MEITVKRLWKKETYTVGRMFVDGEFLCNTLEDTDRGLDDSMPLEQIRRTKVYGKTAIPTGTYNVTSVYWGTHKDYFPAINGVKGFTGILIHGGVMDEHTLGCILIGENKIKGKLLNSQPYVRKLTNMVRKAKGMGETVTITIQ